MSANNVVQGPWGSLPPSADDKITAIDVQEKFIQIMGIVMSEMEKLGVDTLDEEGYIKDLALIAEAVRSYLYKLRNKYHPSQDIADQLFYWSDGQLHMQPSLTVEFK